MATFGDNVGSHFRPSSPCSPGWSSAGRAVEVGGCAVCVGGSGGLDCEHGRKWTGYRNSRLVRGLGGDTASSRPGCEEDRSPQALLQQPSPALEPVPSGLWSLASVQGTGIVDPGAPATFPNCGSRSPRSARGPGVLPSMLTGGLGNEGRRTGEGGLGEGGRTEPPRR